MRQATRCPLAKRLFHSPFTRSRSFSLRSSLLPTSLFAQLRFSCGLLPILFASVCPLTIALSAPN